MHTLRLLGDKDMAPTTSGDSAGSEPRDITPEMAAVRGGPLSTQTNIICTNSRSNAKLLTSEKVPKNDLF